jgi:HJR/Mrr/RecB family endonuclease
MPDYDFKQLSPYDFENLSRDLLQADEGLRLESFKTGRDGGIDFRFAHGSSKSIVQCKHYATTAFAGLLRELRKEAIKVANVCCSPNSGQTRAQLDCPLSADCVAKVFLHC